MVDSSLWVATAVIAFLFITLQISNVTTDTKTLLFIFFATVSSYTFIKHNKAILKNKFSFFLLFFYYFPIGVCAFLFWFMPLADQCFFGIFAFASFLYIVPIQKGGKAIRDFYLLKILWVALSWTGITAYYPLMTQEIEPIFLISFCLQRFLIIIIAIIPFEIVSENTDEISLKTISRVWGISFCKKLNFLLLGVTCMIQFFLLPPQSITEQLGFYFILFFYFLATVFVKNKTNKQWVYFWTEGIPWIYFVPFLICSLYKNSSYSFGFI